MEVNGNSAVNDNVARHCIVTMNSSATDTDKTTENTNTVDSNSTVHYYNTTFSKPVAEVSKALSESAAAADAASNKRSSSVD
jgi:hypothetical protein